MGNLGEKFLNKGPEVGGSLARSRNTKEADVTSTESERERVGNEVRAAA